MSKITSSYLNSYNKLNPEQKLAVDQIAGPILVIAGPGTGKTQLLTTRVGRILEITDSAPQNILCLTFSETAAQTMQDRLVSMIGPAGWDVTISTYHAFGSDLILRYPELFNQKEESLPADELKLDQIVRLICQNLDYSNPLKSDYYVDDIKSLISGYKRSLITPETLRMVCSDNLQFIKSASEIVNRHLEPNETVSPKKLEHYQAILADSATLETKPINGVTSLSSVWLDNLESVLGMVEETGKMTPLSKWKAKWLEKDSRGDWLISSPRVINRQLAMAEIFELYNQELTKQGLYDYDDMILKAINGLETNLDIKLTLQEKYQYILLDEFQDTNVAQFKIVELLSDNPINEGRPNILAVGDDDQAIYRFQGAHYSHMELFYNNYRDTSLVTLKTNYRSTPGIISLSNAIRSQITNSLSLAEKTAISSQPSTPEIIKRVNLKLDVEHLAWSANYVRQLINQGHPPEEIAILAPKHNLLIDIIPYLHNLNIAVNYDKRDNILDDELIDQIIVSAQLVVALSQDNTQTANHLWPIILSYQQWALSTSLIWNLSWQAKDQKKTWLEVILANPKTKVIGLFYIKLAQISEYSSFELMLDYLTGIKELNLNETDLETFTSPFYKTYFPHIVEQRETINSTEWRSLGHLAILSRRIKQSSEDGLNLEQFLNNVMDYKKAKLKIIDQSPFQESIKSVNLMTSHAAKGKEFKTVILLDVNDNSWGTGGKNRPPHISLPPNLAHVRLDNNSQDEKLRLFFVAISRAKNQLIMVNYDAELGGKEVTSLRYLNEGLNETNQLISPLLPDKSQLIEQPDSVPGDSEQIKPLWLTRHLDTLNPKRRAILQDRLKLFKLTATNLNNFTDLTSGGPTKFYLSTILKFPQASSTSSQYGTAIHSVLDWQFKQTKINQGQSPNITDVLIRFQQLLKKQRLAEIDYQQLLKRGTKALQTYLEQTTISYSPNDLSEQSFETNIGQVQLSGEVDRLIIDNKLKTIHIIDFKTGIGYKKFSSELKAFHHSRQLYFYKLLIEQSHQFKGYTITGATIQFVEPDHDSNLINSVSLEFDEQEFIKLVELIKAVWVKIMDLDFPDTSAYPKTLVGIRQFEAALIDSLK